MLNEVEEGLQSIQLSEEDSSSAESQLDKCLVNICAFLFYYVLNVCFVNVIYILFLNVFLHFQSISYISILYFVYLLVEFYYFIYFKMLLYFFYVKTMYLKNLSFIDLLLFACVNVSNTSFILIQVIFHVLFYGIIMT